MEELHFADILMTLVVCGVIYAILTLANRSGRKPGKNHDGTTTCETEPDIGKTSEDN